MGEEKDAERREFGPERRRHPRFPSDFDIKFRKISTEDLSASEETYSFGRLRDISEGGMRFISDWPLEVDEKLEIYTAATGAEKGIFGIVETVRTAKVGFKYEISVKFEVRQEF